MSISGLWESYLQDINKIYPIFNTPSYLFLETIINLGVPTSKSTLYMWWSGRFLALNQQNYGFSITVKVEINRIPEALAKGCTFQTNLENFVRTLVNYCCQAN